MAGILVYRNWRWNTTMAVYMALRGLAVFGLVPIILVQITVNDDSVALGMMLGIASITGGIPLARSLAGKVWIEDGQLCSRNPFRTLRVPLDSIGRITTRALWQNFFTVAAVELSDRGQSHPPHLVPVPSSDASSLATKVDAARL